MFKRLCFFLEDGGLSGGICGAGLKDPEAPGVDVGPWINLLTLGPPSSWCPMGGERGACTCNRRPGRKAMAPRRESTRGHESCECWGPGNALGRWQDLWGKLPGGIPWRVNPRHKALQPWQRIWAPGIQGKGGGLDFRGSNPFGQGGMYHRRSPGGFSHCAL